MSSKDKHKKTTSTFKKVFVSPPGTYKFNKPSVNKTASIKDPGFTAKKEPTILVKATKSSLRKKPSSSTKKGGYTSKMKKKRTKNSTLKKIPKKRVK